MILAAVEHLSPIYRKANTYPQLVDEVVPGQPRRPEPARAARQGLADR
jgi:hypothetical protein